MYEILNRVTDNKIETENLFITTTYGEYLAVAQNIITSNKYQRKRVKSSSTVYSQLKDDMKSGCIFPSIVLALTKEDINNREVQEQNLPDLMENAIILDGLQRTYTMIDAASELSASELIEFNKHLLRIELYININRFGILYRMLTLNTGQTPMSLRHQIEIIYDDLNLTADGITFIKEVDGSTPKEIGDYNFKDMIEGFLSYLNGSYLPQNRNSILETIKTLKLISGENIENDLFKTFVELYNNIIKKMNNLFTEEVYAEFIDYFADEYNLDYPEESLDNFLFAKNIQKLSVKPQLMTGFGAALYELQKRDIIDSIQDLSTKSSDIETGGNSAYEWYALLNEHLNDIKSTSKKIGNAQRFYFSYFFRYLFMEGEETYLNLAASAEYAKKIYDRDN